MNDLASILFLLVILVIAVISYVKIIRLRAERDEVTEEIYLLRKEVFRLKKLNEYGRGCGDDYPIIDLNK